MQNLPEHISWIKEKNDLFPDEWNKIDFIQKTIAQIDKDFSNFIPSHIGENIDFDKNFNDSIILHIKQNLDKMERENASFIPQLIYLIDLPEAVFHSITEHSSAINHDLAQCILVREAYKVWMRTRY